MRKKRFAALLMATVIFLLALSGPLEVFASISSGSQQTQVTATATDHSTYTVTFNANGGSSVASQSVIAGKQISSPETPLRPGYSFLGWYQDTTFTQLYDFSSPVTCSFTLYAKWEETAHVEEIYYTVSFVMNGGTTINPQRILKGNAALQPTDTPTKRNYVFTGWYADETCQHPYDFATPIIADTKIYAGWNRTSYDVSFIVNGGSFIATQTVNKGNCASRPTDPIRSGYQFAGWYSDSSFAHAYNFSAVVTDDLRLYAKWTLQTSSSPQTTYYSVSFDSKGGSSVSSQVVISGSYAMKPADPTRSGYQFDGWYMDENYNYAYSFSSTVTRNLLLYAKWKKEEPQTYIVIFEENGGTTISNQTVVSGELVERPTAPTRKGFVFAGWYSDPNLYNRYDFSRPVTSNFSLYAKWEKESKSVIKYTVRFNSNGGSSVAAQKVKKNQTVTKPKNPTKSGYVFKGWYTSAAFKTKYSFNSKVTRNLTLYAKWQIKKTVTISTTPESQQNTPASSVPSQIVRPESSNNVIKPAVLPQTTPSPQEEIQPELPSEEIPAEPAEDDPLEEISDIEKAYISYMDQYHLLSDEQRTVWNNADINEKYALSEQNPDIYDTLYELWGDWQTQIGNDITPSEPTEDPPTEEPAPSTHQVSVPTDLEEQPEDDHSGSVTAGKVVAAIAGSSAILFTGISALTGKGVIGKAIAKLISH